MAEDPHECAVRAWRKALKVVEAYTDDSVMQGAIMSFVSLHALEVAMERELKRSEEIAHSLLGSLLTDVASALSRDGRVVKITLDWHEPEEA